jgi:PAS domain S-box-containing protein
MGGSSDQDQQQHRTIIMTHSGDLDELSEATVQKPILSEAPDTDAEARPGVTEGIVTLGTNATILSCNAQAETIAGYTLEQLQTLGLATLFDPPEVMQHILNKSRAGLVTLSDYLQLRRADGQFLPVLVQCAPQRHNGESEGQAVLVFRAVTKREPMHRQDEHLMVLGRLASSLSHDIGNHFNTVSLHADLLDDEVQDLPSELQGPLVESVVDIRAEITRLHDLIEDLLSLARLTRLHRESENLEAYLVDLRPTLEELLVPHHIVLCLEDLDGLGEVALHHHTFRQMWLQIVHYAIDAMPQGGKLTIRGKRLVTQVQLEISDTGGGIPDAQLPLLCLPFPLTQLESTGLGLYVVQEIVSAHAGAMTVSSSPGQGTTLIISLPLADISPTASE